LMLVFSTSTLMLVFSTSTLMLVFSTSTLMLVQNMLLSAVHLSSKAYMQKKFCSVRLKLLTAHLLKLQVFWYVRVEQE
jgi:hypothetical protein